MQKAMSSTNTQVFFLRFRVQVSGDTTKRNIQVLTLR